jgi:hypothetical protein
MDGEKVHSIERIDYSKRSRSILPLNSSQEEVTTQSPILTSSSSPADSLPNPRSGVGLIRQQSLG